MTTTTDRYELLTVDEVAAELRMSRRWVNDQIARGALAHIDLGGKHRVSRDQLLEFLTARTVPATGQPADHEPAHPEPQPADTGRVVPIGDGLTSRSRAVGGRF